MAKSLVVRWCAILAVLLGNGRFAVSEHLPGDSAKAQITILYDAFGKDPSMEKDWGYSALVEYAGKRILFDAGNNPEILARNDRAKGIDFATLDFVVMSHRHGDHMGGLAQVLKVNPKVTIYAPKEGFGVFGGDLPGTFFRRDPSLAAEQRYFDGMLYLDYESPPADCTEASYVRLRVVGRRAVQ